MPAKGENTVSFQTRLSGGGAHAGQIILKKAGLTGNPSANFALDAQEKAADKAADKSAAR